MQTAEYWPAGTVFVSVVDPGVGTDRKSIVLKTTSGHYFVTPDNGALTFVAPRSGSRRCARLTRRRTVARTGKVIHFPRPRHLRLHGGQTGRRRHHLRAGRARIARRVVTIPHEEARYADGVVYGNIQTDERNDGNIWTNVDRATFKQLKATLGEPVRIKILKDGVEVLNLSVPYAETFGAVEVGKPLLYMNSLDSVSLAINQGNFASTHAIGSGPEAEHPNSSLTLLSAQID